jgi:hypothetical protein
MPAGFEPENVAAQSAPPTRKHTCSYLWEARSAGRLDRKTVRAARSTEREGLAGGRSRGTERPSHDIPTTQR